MNPCRLVCSFWPRQVGWLMWPRCLGRLSLKRDLYPSALVCRAHVTCLSIYLVAIKLQNKKWIRKVAEPPWWKCKYTILRLSIIQVSSTMSQISKSQAFLFVFGAFLHLCLCVCLYVFLSCLSFVRYIYATLAHIIHRHRHRPWCTLFFMLVCTFKHREHKIFGYCGEFRLFCHEIKHFSVF